MTTTAEKIYVMNAYVNGETIQFKSRNTPDNDWLWSTNPIWDWNRSEYRIKPVPVEPRVLYRIKEGDFMYRTHHTRRDAEDAIRLDGCFSSNSTVVKFIEVLDDDK